MRFQFRVETLSPPSPLDDKHQAQASVLAPNIAQFPVAPAYFDAVLATDTWKPDFFPALEPQTVYLQNLKT